MGAGLKMKNIELWRNKGRHISVDEINNLLFSQNLFSQCQGFYPNSFIFLGDFKYFLYINGESIKMIGETIGMIGESIRMIGESIGMLGQINQSDQSDDGNQTNPIKELHFFQL